ncbi:transglycosylase SLT domain-containing protein [Pseudoxanthomonas composti]|uniref:LysM peptidoglycan-binding domain-containing protein n=1 Tax=Pseudoxanthomonas composti TaxID=2137479 RepID=A0A4Q1JU11_9GAMM|nr:transglycosylase SLT domain-containing protein [Pseudoxanthomonas composti]RXR05170.1 LysM peptidoglycan-binding domain-containing protein [Pseudoxanthomonas composti]
MPVHVFRACSRPLLRRLPLLVLLPLLSLSGHALARVSAKDQAAIDALNQRMAQAERRYADALVLTANSDPKGQVESDAALEDMEDVIDACIKQRNCQPHTLLATYKRLLKQNADASAEAADDEVIGEGDPLDDGNDHSAPMPALPESARTERLLNDRRHDFDAMVEYNPAVQAGIRRWLTDMRGTLITSYENYQNMRPQMQPGWQGSGLPEALLFGIMAKESNGKVHVSSRAGAAGPLQFMPATGRRFNLGPDGTGFDTRFDAYASAEAAAAYMNERMRELNNSIEYALAAYNGGEGRAARVFRQYGGRGFWDADVYREFPPETQDYVPMVIAAAWLYLHPKQYGLEFPKLNIKPATFKLARAASIYELTICLGNGGTREGFMRTLRNLNPRYQAETWIPAGASLNATTHIANLYQRYCVSGPRAELARTLVTADLSTALRREPPRTGNVAVGEVAAVPGVPTTVATGTPKPATPKTRQTRQYKVARGDTLGGIAGKFDCEVPELAKANKLRAPGYALKPGQQLKLVGCGR